MLPSPVRKGRQRHFQLCGPMLTPDLTLEHNWAHLNDMKMRRYLCMAESFADNSVACNISNSN